MLPPLSSAFATRVLCASPKSQYWYDANGNIDTLARFDNDGNQYDGLGYRYHLDENDRKVRNRLYQVRELADQSDLYANDVSDLPYLDEEIVDPTGQGDPDLGQNINQLNNYSYDEIGNLIKDRNEEIDKIRWTVAGKVKAVERPSSSGKNDLLFAYGAGGQRIVKEVQDDAGVPLYRDHYVRDAQGNVMAMYRHTIGEGSLKVTERPIYGSTRLGTDAYELELGGNPPYDELPDLTGTVRYELTDHLGNVTAVITDEILGVDDDNDQEIEYFQPYLLSAQGYEPFGSLLPGRNYSSDAYRFAFNGKENDDEWHGATGTLQDYGMRAYDTRVARFFAVDPIAAQYPMLTPYQFASNSPIRLIDIDGLEGGALEDFVDNTKSYIGQVVSNLVESIVQSTAKYVHELVADEYQKVQSEWFIEATGTMTVGSRYARDLPRKYMGGDVNFGSYDLVSVELTWSESNGGDIVLNYVGKDGKVIHTAGAHFSGTSPGAPLGAGAGYSFKEESNVDRTGSSTRWDEVSAGLATKFINAVLSGSKEMDSNRSGAKYTGSATAGQAGAAGAGIVIEMEIKGGYRVSYDGRDNDDD